MFTRIVCCLSICAVVMCSTPAVAQEQQPTACELMEQLIEAWKEADKAIQEYIYQQTTEKKQSADEKLDVLRELVEELRRLADQHGSDEIEDYERAFANLLAAQIRLAAAKMVPGGLFFSGSEEEAEEAYEAAKQEFEEAKRRADENGFASLAILLDPIWEDILGGYQSGLLTEYLEAGSRLRDANAENWNERQEEFLAIRDEIQRRLTQAYLEVCGVPPAEQWPEPDPPTDNWWDQPADQPVDFRGVPIPEFPGVESFATLPTDQQQQSMTAGSAWVDGSDPRVVQNVEARASSWEAVLRDVVGEGRDDELARIAEDLLDLIAGLHSQADELANQGESTAVAAEIISAQKWALVVMLGRLQNEEVLSFQQLLAAAGGERPPPGQAGAQFAKVQAQSEGQPVPGATMVFHISRETPQGTQQTTQIATADERGEVELNPSEDDEVIAENRPGEVQVGTEDTIHSIVVTGNTGEQAITYQDAESDTPDTLVIQTEPQSEHKVVFAVAADRLAAEDGQPNPDILKMAEVQGVLLGYLLSAVGDPDVDVPDALQIPDPRNLRPDAARRLGGLESAAGTAKPILGSARNRRSRNSGGIRTPVVRRLDVSRTAI